MSWFIRFQEEKSSTPAPDGNHLAEADVCRRHCWNSRMHMSPKRKKRHEKGKRTNRIEGRENSEAERTTLLSHHRRLLDRRRASWRTLEEEYRKGSICVASRAATHLIKHYQRKVATRQRANSEPSESRHCEASFTEQLVAAGSSL